MRLLVEIKQNWIEIEIDIGGETELVMMRIKIERTVAEVKKLGRDCWGKYWDMTGKGWVPSCCCWRENVVP